MSSSNPFAQTLHLDTAPYASGASLSPAGKQARHHGRTHSGSSISLSTPVYPGSQPSSSPHSHSWGSFRSSLSPAAFPASASDPSSPGSDPGQSGSVAKSQSHSHSADQIAPSMIGLPLSVNPYGRTTNFDVDHPQSYDTGTMSGLMNPPSTTGLGYTAQQYIQSSLPPQTPDEPRPSLLVTQQRYAAAQQKKLSEQAWRQQLQSQEAARALQEQQLGNIFPSLAHTHSAFPGNTRSDTTSSGESLGLNQPWAQAAGSGVFQHTNSSTSPLSLSPSHARANSFSNPPSSISQTLTSAGVSIDGSAAFPAPDNAALTSLGLGSSNDHILSSPYRSGSFFVASPPSASGDLLGSGSPNGNNNPYPLFPAESYNQQALFSSPPMGSYGGGGGGAAAANVQLNQSNSSAYPFPQTMSSSGPNNLANTLSISTNTSPGAAAPTSTTSRAQRQPASASASASTSTSPSSPQKQNQRNQPPRSTRARPSPTSTRKGPAHARTTSGGSVPASRVTQKNASSHRPEKRSRAEEAEESESDDGDGDGLDSGGKDGRSAEGGVKPRLPGACTHCKRLKMRCVFPEGEDVCVRCRNSNNRVECVVEARRPRQGPTKREQLIAQLRKKDKIIDVLLKRAYNPSVITPLTLSHSALLNNNNSNNNNGNGNGNADITGLSLPRLPDFSAAEGQTFDQDAILAWIEGSSSAASDTPDWAASAGAGAGMLGEGLGNGRMLSDDGLSEDEGASGPAETGTGNGNGNGNGAEGGGGDDSESGSRTSPIPPRPRSQQSQYTREPKLHSLPPVPTPIGLLAGLSLDASKTKSMRMLKERERRKSDRGKASDVGANDGSGGGGAAVNGNGNGNGNRSGNGNGKRASESWSADDEAVDIDMELDSADAAQEDDVGIANDKYFKPSAIVNPDLRSIIIERQVPPAILFSGLVTPAEVELLFNIFFEKLNPFVGVLDRAIHGPQQVLKRCPFLFTVVCAISSRYHTERPELYQLAMHFAKTSAATTLIDGWKSVEICQAYILLSTYPVPAKRWEEDRTWLYLGLAIRMATDLNLHLPSTTKPTSEAHEREILNRTRVWLICFNLDRSHATMFGRPNTIREDWIIRNSKDWYKRSKYNHPYDIHLCTYTQLLRIVARFLEIVYSDPHSPSGLNKTVDYAAVTKKFDEELLAFKEDAAARFAVESDPNDPGCVYRTELMPFLVNYSRLVMYSFGFQQAFDKGLARDDMFFVQCFHAASSVVRILIDKLAPHGHLRFSPDGNFIFASFACAFLVKLLRPQFGSTVDQTQRTRVVELVSRLVKVLGSEKTAIDEQHTPKLYARFLESILAKQGGEVIDADDSAAPPSSKTGSTPLKITLPSSREPPTASSSTDTDTTAHQAMRSPEIHIVPAPLETATQPIPTQNANGNGLSGLNAGHLNGSPDTRFLNADDALSSGSTIEAGGSDTATHYSADEEMMPIPAEARLASMRVLEEGSRWWDHGMMPGYDPDSPLQWGIWGAMEGPADFSNAMAAFAGVPDGQDVVMDINGNDDIFQNDFSAMSGNNFVPYRRS